jgi:hypothetical protein
MWGPFEIMHLDIVERTGRAGKYDAFVGDRLIVSSTRQPFFDGARALIAFGVAPETVLIMRRRPIGTESLRSTVGAAAKLTVLEANFGSAPRFGLFQEIAPGALKILRGLSD